MQPQIVREGQFALAAFGRHAHRLRREFVGIDADALHDVACHRRPKPVDQVRELAESVIEGERYRVRRRIVELLEHPGQVRRLPVAVDYLIVERVRQLPLQRLAQPGLE